MKKGITVEEVNNTVYLRGGMFPCREYTLLDYDLKNDYLSWENASYMYSEPDEEEADDYLLNHALQENKKLCVCISTSDSEHIKKHFADYDEFGIYVQKTVHHKNDNVFVYRRGCLADYFDMEYIEDLFLANGVRVGILPILEKVEIEDFVTGKYIMNGVPYNLIMDTEDLTTDMIIATFGPSALIVSGLIFGYPIEIIIKAISMTVPY